MDWTLKVNDLAIVFATLIGPVLAVQAQKWIERGRERHQRRVTTFRVLMTTRAAILSPAHVEALNAVPIEFYSKKAALRAVVNAWKTYIDHLYKEIIDNRAWVDKRVELLNTLLAKMAEALGYNFNAVEISRELYSPKGHAMIESDQEIIRKGFVKLFRGEMAIPMAVQSFPTDPKFLENQLHLQTQLLRWLAGELGVRVVMSDDGGTATEKKGVA
jgi:hypothetical protein